MFKVLTHTPEVIATIGPSSESEEVLRTMLSNGLRIGRFNFSHGDYETQKKRVDLFLSLAQEGSIPHLVFADLSGPKVRVGKLENGSVELLVGASFSLTTKEIVGSAICAHVTYAHFTKGIQAGMKILLDDGRIELVVENVTEDTAQTRVLRGGMLLEEKGVNVPEALWSLSSLTEKDLQDLSFIMNENYHAIALSFVRSKENIEEARKYMQTTFNKTLPIITKIETRQALHNLETIIESSDVVMVARGDLGVEIGLEHVPMHQKRICEVASRYNKPVIVATQLLESMVESPTPTRAEVSDVVNAILDGASYIMLSDETTTGKYPIEAVSTLSTIIKDYNATV